MGMRIGICGAGSLAGSFIPFFKHHPDVENVVLCDPDAAKLYARCAQFAIGERCSSLDELCTMDVDAIAIMTQRTRDEGKAPTECIPWRTVCRRGPFE